MIGDELNRELNDLHASIGRINSKLTDIERRLEQLQTGGGTINKVESRLSRELNRILQRIIKLEATIWDIEIWSGREH